MSDRKSMVSDSCNLDFGKGFTKIEPIVNKFGDKNDKKVIVYCLSI